MTNLKYQSALSAPIVSSLSLPSCNVNEPLSDYNTTATKFKKYIKSLKSFLIIFTLITISIACKKDNEVTSIIPNTPSITPKIEKCLLTKVEYFSNGIKNELHYKKYFYNEKKLRIKDINVEGMCKNEGCYITREYDSNNNLIKTQSYEHNVKVSYTTFNYDNKGNLIKEIVYDSNDIEVRAINNEFNLQGKITKSTNYFQQKLSFSITYDYDSRLNLLEKRYSINGPSERHTYDSQNNRMETQYFYNGSLTSIVNYKYDNKNRVVLLTSNSITNQTIYSYETLYDDNQNIVTTTLSATSGGQKTELSTIINYHDINNRLIKQEYFDEREKLYSITTKKYNSDGFIIFDEVYYPQSNFKQLIESSYICS